MSLRETEPLSPPTVTALYRGAVAVGGAAPTAVLCGTRLGVSPSTLRHLHGGWIDWPAGRLRVPASEPCSCRDCCETAREVAADTDQSPLRVLYDQCWTAPHGGRRLSFGWSRRLTAVLAHTIDRRLDRDHAHDGRPFERGLAAAADAAPGIDPAGVDWQRLRATAAQFFARSGVRAATLAVLLGVDQETATTAVRRHGTAPADAVAARFDGAPGGEQRADGESGVASGAGVDTRLDRERFPLVTDPTPFDGEPFDPRSFGDDWRTTRAVETSDERRLSNPRPSDVPADADYDPARHGPSHRAYDEHVRWTETGPVSTLAGAVARDDEPEIAEGDTEVAGNETETAENDTESVENDTATVENDTATADNDTKIADSDTETVENDTQAALGTDAGEASLAPRNRATEPIRATETTQVAIADLNGGQPTTARVVLGDAEIVVASESASVTIPLETVVDVAVDYVPSGMTDVFEETVAVAYRRDGDRRLAVGEFSGRRQRDVADTLFAALLDGKPVLVTHPARVGGRVTDADPEPCTVVSEGRRLRFRATTASDAANDDGSTVVTTVEPTGLVHAERGRQRVADGGSTRKAVKVRHDDDGRRVTTEIGARDDRVFQVLERRITHDYRRREERLQELELSDEETETLVALYSAGDEMDVGMLLDVDPDGLGEILESLSAKGLVDVENDPGLTAMGETAVSERLEDVNV
jgi:helix-turn-helix protein